MKLSHLIVPIEYKFDAGDSNDKDAMEFSGYGAIFGNVDSYGDVIAPGAFAETLAESKKSGIWPSLLLQHGGFFGSAKDMTPIGVISDLVEDGVGLRMKATLAPTTEGKDIYALLKMKPRPALNGLSIGYVAKEYTPRTKPEEPRRTLKKIDLFEISLVTFPANGKARVQSVKSDLTIRDAEEALRDAGFPSVMAKRILSQGYSASEDTRDADEEAKDVAESVRRVIQTIKS